MLLRKKLDSPHYRFYIEAHFSKERIEFCDAIKEEFNMSRKDIFLEGLRSLLDKKKEIMARIFSSDYIVAYMTKGYKIVEKKMRGVGYTTIYIYNIEAMDAKYYRVYFKYNNDSSDYKYNVWKRLNKTINKNIIDEYPISTLEELPE